MKKENADPENLKKRRADPRQKFPTDLGSVPQIWEKLGAVPAKTSKTLSSKARWPGKVVPGFFQSSQATVLDLWPSPDLQGSPGTQLHTFWNQLETTQKHRKRTDLTGKCLKQKVVPGLF